MKNNGLISLIRPQAAEKRVISHIFQAMDTMGEVSHDGLPVVICVEGPEYTRDVIPKLARGRAFKEKPLRFP